MRGPTAFFLFSEEKREQTRAECVAAVEPGAKISVAVVAKAIGEKWRALSDAEKAEYQEKASQRAKQLAESAAAAAENQAGVLQQTLPGVYPWIFRKFSAQYRACTPAAHKDHLYHACVCCQHALKLTRVRATGLCTK